MRNRDPLGTEGSALVEGALVLPVLLLLVFGTMDVALYLWQWNAANKAVHLGVRKAIVSDSVAVGAGLTGPESAAYWHDLPWGERCAPGEDNRSACPRFVVQCGASEGCTCSTSGCAFRFVQAHLTPILDAMRATLPRLRPDQVKLGYATNDLGYVGRPVPVPVDVTVSIVGVSYELLFLDLLVGPSIPIRVSATLPSEDLMTD